MSEASFEMVLTELREAAPPAPERLRGLVRSLPAAKPRFSLRVRPVISAAIVTMLVVGVGASIYAGLRGDPAGHLNRGNFFSAPEPAQPHGADRASRAKAPSPQFEARIAPGLTAKSRLQKQDVAMQLRVDDLSGATQSAVRTTRRLGGFVASADYATSSENGNSRLALRVPVANLQKAIASFTQLGTILSQHISVADLQGGLDRLDARIAKAHRAGHDRTVQRLERRRDALIREGTYARVSLQLTTAKPTAQRVAPGRFDRFWDNTSDILGKELIAVLYVFVLAGPFVLIAALLLLAERMRRRRADHRLLEETG
jgi:Domain of unknown function (DUF4349)